MILKNLTDEVLNLVIKSIEASKQLKLVDNTPILLLKVILEEDTILRNILEDLEIDLYGIFNQISIQLDRMPKGEDYGSFTEDYKTLFELSHTMALKNHDKFLALDILLISGIAKNNVFWNILHPFIDMDLLEFYIKSLRGDRKITEKTFKEQSFLNAFCTDLNEKCLKNNSNKIYGRVDETDRVSNILSKKTKNNPILVGEPGVGKTAIVEGLAYKIIKNEIENLDRAIIWSLDLTSLIANASQNEIAGRLNGLIKEIQRKNKIEKNEIILFIDEIHLIVGANGGVDLANILKPALARGELKTIGATTTKEYNKYFEKDPAIQRRFQIVKVNEPTEEETLTILRGVGKKISEFHKVEIQDEALTDTIKLSKRYITDRFFPDKAIDLLDEAASTASNSRFIESTQIKKLRIEKQQLQFKIKAIQKSIKSNSKEAFVQKQNEFMTKLQEKELTLNSKLNTLVEEFETFKHLRQEAISLKKEIETVDSLIFQFKSELKLHDAINSEKKKIALTKQLEEIEKNIPSIKISSENIAEVVQQWTGIPMDKILKDEKKDNIKNIEKILKSKIKGQSDAISNISKVIRRNSAGLSNFEKPIGSFMFLGPTGTGKTETAKCLAELVFGDKSNMVRFDMSEFQEPHSISKFIGSPAGYIGHEDGGQLTNAIKKNPYSLILFDEIEKAHPKIFDVLLQVLDDGRLRDGKGNVVDFTNTIIIFTSNIGGMDLAKIPNETVKNKEKMRLLQKHYKPEFLNRLDSINVFNPLEVPQLIQILNVNIDKLTERLWDDKFITLIVSNEFKAKLIMGIDIVEYGARPLNRLISSHIEDKITDFILDGLLKAGDEIIFDIDEENGKNIIEVV